MWNPHDIAAEAARALDRENDRLLAERSPFGPDALDEVGVQDLLARGLAGSGLGVLREVRYPRADERRRGRPPRDSERLRCDLVLTPAPGQRLTDPVVTVRARRAARARAAGTLFEVEAERAIEAGLADPTPGAGEDRIEPGGAFWLEVKTVVQTCYTHGVPGPNTAYTSELLRGVSADLTKLASDPALVHAGAMLVLMGADDRTVDHDLGVVVERVLGRDLGIASPVIERFGLADRVGNGAGRVLLIPLRRVREA